MADGPSREQLEALLALQESETITRRLQRRLDELPEQAALNAVAAKAATVKAEHDARRVDLEHVEAQMRKLEGELTLLEQRRNAEERRLYSGEVTSPRELQAIRADIEHVARRIAALEDELLQLLEQREQLLETIAQLEQRGRDLAAEQRQLTAVRDESAREVLADLTEARGFGELQRGRLPGQLLARYETSKQRRGGVGVGALEHGICTGCRMELTPLEVSELREAGPLGVCPQCQRLLVVLE